MEDSGEIERSAQASQRAFAAVTADDNDLLSFKDRQNGTLGCGGHCSISPFE
jgi:hypothetical protein